MGDPTHQQLVRIGEMKGWRSYDEAERMKNDDETGGLKEQWRANARASRRRSNRCPGAGRCAAPSRAASVARELLAADHTYTLGIIGLIAAHARFPRDEWSVFGGWIGDETAALDV